MSLTVQQKVRDVAERVGWSFLQPFVVLLTATGSAALHDHQAWEKAAFVGLWAAMISLATALLAASADWHPAGYVALVDRAGRTFLSTFLGVIVAGQFISFDDTGASAAAATAVCTAFLAALKSLIGSANGATVGDTTLVPANAPQV